VRSSVQVLLVEDEAHLAAGIRFNLQQEGFTVELLGDGQQALERLTGGSAGPPVDLVILDVTMPVLDGPGMLAKMRERGDKTPVLMLTGRIAVNDRVDGLNTGADDYLTKPFSLAEFLARVRTLLRRVNRPLQASLQAGDLVLDRTSHRVTADGQDVELSPKEFSLLEYLLLHKDKVVSRTEISEHVWDDSFDSFANVIDVTVHRLRKKIDGERTSRLLHTVKGVGYMLRSERS
jgi:DNA-binding response OmpR family regulator